MEPFKIESLQNNPMFLSHGGRPTKGNGRKRKGVDEYAAENRIDFTSRSIIRDGQLVRILVCRFCCQSIGARSDRIKEHLASKRHQKLKLEAFREAAENGRDLTQEYSDDSVPGLLPEPPITMLKFPGKALAHLLEGGGDRREMTPEAEDRKPAMPTPPPLKEHLMSSPPPSQMGLLHNAPHHLASQLSSSLRSSSPIIPQVPRSADRDSSSTKEPPQQLLCVRWGNFDSNIVSMFTKLRSQEHFVDATLWCEGQTIKCHKMILSACSTYFEKLLTENPNPHPIIFLKDMRFWEINALVEFMYRGEVSIHQEKLQSLLRAAESLQIKGLGSPSANEAGVNLPSSGLGLGDSSSIMDDDLSNETNELSQSNNNNTNTNTPTIRDRDSSGCGSYGHSTTGHGHSQRESSASSASLNLSRSESLLSSMNMGMDLSNHSMHSSTPLNNNSITNNNNILGSNPPAKRRKKETPRRIDIPRANLPLPVFNPPVVDHPNEDEEREDGNCSDDSMAAHERNHVDVVYKVEPSQHPEMTYEDEDNYGENDPGSQMEEERSDSEIGGDGQLDDPEGYTTMTDESGALALTRVTSATLSERERLERSRKGNPIKKIHLHPHNNNNNNEQATNLIHSGAGGAD